MDARDDFAGLLPLVRLHAWLDPQLPGRGEPFAAVRMEAGTSNEKFRLERAGRRWVLRRPPRVPLSASAHAMMREVRVLRALDGTRVPHPAVVAACDDPDVIGAPFYVMEYVDGFTAGDPLPPPFDADRAARRGLGLALVDGIAELASVDWLAAGLDGFGKPDGFLERQVRRWLGQLAQYQTRTLPGLDAVARWLDEHVPPASAPAIVHGDYQFINALFHHGAPARLAAIVDWEQSTIGDPLLDLGWLLSGWSDPGEPLPYTGYFTQRDGLPTRAELAARYAAHTGRGVDVLPYYVVLSFFKLACIMEGGYARYRSGQTKNPAYAQLETVVPRLLRDAERAIASA